MKKRRGRNNIHEVGSELPVIDMEDGRKGGATSPSSASPWQECGMAKLGAKLGAKPGEETPSNAKHSVDGGVDMEV